MGCDHTAITVWLKRVDSIEEKGRAVEFESIAPGERSVGNATRLMAGCEMVRGLSATTAGVALSMGSIGWTSGSWTQRHAITVSVPARGRRIMLFGLLVLAIGIGGAASTVVARSSLGVAKCVTRNSHTV